MMFKIVCDYCGEDIVFSDLNQKPETCHNCNSFLGDMEVRQLSSEVEKKGGNEDLWFIKKLERKFISTTRAQS
jgi:hypothetical protein